MGQIRSRKLWGVIAVAAVGVTTGIVGNTLAAGGETGSGLVPITACRLADTRPGTDRVGSVGTLGPAATATFKAVGDNGKCLGIPADATALSLNITALGATQQTFLTIWPNGDRPLAASLNPAPGQPPTPNAVTTPLSTTGEFQMYNQAGTVNVVIDVNGYYTRAGIGDGDGYGRPYQRASIKSTTEGCSGEEVRLALTLTGPGTYFGPQTPCTKPTTDPNLPQSGAFRSYSIDLVPVEGAADPKSLYEAKIQPSITALNTAGQYNLVSGTKQINGFLFCNTVSEQRPSGAWFQCIIQVSANAVETQPGDPQPDLTAQELKAALDGLTASELALNQFLTS